MSRFVVILFLLLFYFTLSFSNLLQNQNTNLIKSQFLNRKGSSWNIYADLRKLQSSSADLSKARQFLSKIFEAKNFLRNEIEKGKKFKNLKVDLHKVNSTAKALKHKKSCTSPKKRRNRRHLTKRRRLSRKKLFKRKISRWKKRKSSTRNLRRLPKNSAYAMSLGSGQTIIILPLPNTRGGTYRGIFWV